ncbi:PilZ domain-containing protein [Myxococcota bacterium]|nr:PilZ domain-containing protein [Myxococcota bacterium]
MTVTLHEEGRPVVVSHLENVSLNGAFVAMSVPPPVGARCQVRIDLGALDEDGQPMEVRAIGRVVRVEARGCALQFVELHGLASLEHLRNLVLYNAREPARAEEEFRSHLGLERA